MAVHHQEQQMISNASAPLLGCFEEGLDLGWIKEVLRGRLEKFLSPSPRHNEADTGIKLSRVPLYLGDYPARLAPACRLIGEVGVEPSHLVRRATDRALEQIPDPILENLIGWNTD